MYILIGGLPKSNRRTFASPPPPVPATLQTSTVSQLSNQLQTAPPQQSQTTYVDNVTTQDDNTVPYQHYTNLPLTQNNHDLAVSHQSVAASVEQVPSDSPSSISSNTQQLQHSQHGQQQQKKRVTWDLPSETCAASSSDVYSDETSSAASGSSSGTTAAADSFSEIQVTNKVRL